MICGILSGYCYLMKCIGDDADIEGAGDIFEVTGAVTLKK